MQAMNSLQWTDENSIFDPEGTCESRTRTNAGVEATSTQLPWSALYRLLRQFIDE
jgi:hypothetical protein